MTQEAQDHTIWRPEYDGHAPPNWKEGMACKGHSGKPLSRTPTWYEGVLYYVPSEALTAPNEDDDAAFDVAIWLEQGRANLDKLPEGVVLPEPKDWATELWADLWEAQGSPEDAELVRSGETSIADRAAIALIRERIVLKGEG